MVHPIFFWSILGYLGILVIVALYFSRRISTQADFAVAGRSLPTFVVFGTLVATWMGSGSLFGHSELAYTSGMVVSLILVADVLGFGLLYFLAGRIHDMEQYTVQDLLELRYNAAARAFGSIALIIAYTTIVSYQFRAAGSVLSLVRPSISPEQGAMIAAVFIIGFTVTAGLFSVAYTDLIQGITMIVGMVICLPLLVSKAGGLDAVVQALPAGHLNPFHNFSLLKTLGLVLPVFLLLLGDANMYQRFFAARSQGSAKRAVLFVIFGVLLVELMIVFAAIVGRVLEPDVLIPGRVIVFAALNHLPLLLAVVILTAVSAIVVSTADSYLLSPATAFARDIYQRFLFPNASEREMVLVSRISVVALGVAALALSRLSSEFLSVALYAYTIYGASITPALMAALFWRRVTTKGALSSIVGGTLVTLGWKLVSLPDSLKDVDAVLPAITVSTLLLIVVSLSTAKQSYEKVRAFGFSQ